MVSWFQNKIGEIGSDLRKTRYAAMTREYVIRVRAGGKDKWLREIGEVRIGLCEKKGEEEEAEWRRKTEPESSEERRREGVSFFYQGLYLLLLMAQLFLRGPFHTPPLSLVMDTNKCGIITKWYNRIIQSRNLNPEYVVMWKFSTRNKEREKKRSVGKMHIRCD